MGLTLSEEKTKVTHITEGFDFLGYRIIRSIGTRGKMVPKVLIPEKAIKQFRLKVREILAPSYNQGVNRIHNPKTQLVDQRVVRILQKYK